MADTIVFDTYRFVRNLTAKGFTEEQAEALAYEQVQLLENSFATKADLAATEARLRTDIERVKAELEAKIEAIRADLLKWMFGAMVAQGGLIVALVKLL